MKNLNAALSVTGLTKTYGRRRALDALTLALPRHALIGLVGANGAGKTTFMLTVAGFLRPDAGEIDLLGDGPFDAAVHSGRFAILPQDSALPDTAHPRELLTQYGCLQGLPRAAAIAAAHDILKSVHLGDRMDASVRSLSHGMRKRVMIAQCFIGFPELVFLDEPLNGLDPVEIVRMRHFIAGRKGRQTVLISSHNLHDIEQLCDYVAFMDHGKLTRFASIDEIIGKHNTLVYRLAHPLADTAALAAALPPSITLSAEGTDVRCHYLASSHAPEQVNALVIPLLLQHGGLVSITQGNRLEEEYLKLSTQIDLSRLKSTTK